MTPKTTFDRPYEATSISKLTSFIYRTLKDTDDAVVYVLFTEYVWSAVITIAARRDPPFLPEMPWSRIIIDMTEGDWRHGSKSQHVQAEWMETSHDGRIILMARLIERHIQMDWTPEETTNNG